MPDGKVEGMQPPNAAFEKVGAGLPEAVTWKLAEAPTGKVVNAADVIAGALVLGLPGAPEGAPAGVSKLTGALLVVPRN